ncbi:peptidoglycan hydrolase-like protein with peptidoglycan-binding domain [Stackebrandtia albiflava]|uniref:Peptidoglycan hydrolase-like protein with peptidoglycan-binding domain n=1 Tax=Stackebrandtia albiflava TaxID=406432 RepID=A0A562VE82_9ACTN|nr:N-acetylmuramoyl-L-alanine amidase [Stackebrandtia albiflava]TWJ16199.1 peptidoglycan hydrolase-like protein with peptidoglycan-binding domain [Stackebrandtia albiflava]
MPENTPEHAVTRRTVLYGGLTVAAGAAIGGALPSVAAAAPATPRIHSTSEWGARPPSSPVQLNGYRPTFIVVHHTATSNSVSDTVSRAYTLARAIQNHHMDVKGWIDSGQQFTISRGGHILEGRSRSLETLRGGTRFVYGSHAGGSANPYSIGIENEGTYTSVAPPAALYDSLVAFCAHACHQYGIAASQIFGHRDYMSTACPGDRLYAMLPQLRADVADLLGTDPGPVWPTVRRGAANENVRTVQYLLRQHGATITVDGQFGPATETAVKTFQGDNGLVADGVVGPKTWPELILSRRRGDSGEAVRAIQRRLDAVHGIPMTVDGQFGPATETGVRQFQTAQRISVDGVVGPQSWLHLVG